MKPSRPARVSSESPGGRLAELYERHSRAAVEIASGARRGPEHRIEWGPVEGILNPHYRHDERSFLRICKSAEVEPAQIFEREWAGRQRLFLRLDKPVTPLDTTAVGR